MTNDKKEYSYRELGRMKRARAIVSVDKEIRNIIGLPKDPHWIDKIVIECVISILNPVFNDLGYVKLISTTNKKMTKDKLQKIYDQCKMLVP